MGVLYFGSLRCVRSFERRAREWAVEVEREREARVDARPRARNDDETRATVED